jgi:hypothetical protein
VRTSLSARIPRDDALAIRPPRPTVIRRDLDRHHCAAFDHCFRQQLPPPSEQLVAVHIMTSRHDRHRRSRRLRLRHHLALQPFRILSTLRRARLLLAAALTNYLAAALRLSEIEPVSAAMPLRLTEILERALVQVTKRTKK